MDSMTIFWGVFFSIIGIAYFSYGKRNDIYFCWSGIALMLFPYFFTKIEWLLCIGVGLIVLPFLIKKNIK